MVRWVSRLPHQDRQDACPTRKVAGRDAGSTTTSVGPASVPVIWRLVNGYQDSW